MNNWMPRISDEMVVLCYDMYQEQRSAGCHDETAFDVLERVTGKYPKIVWRAAERACDRGFPLRRSR